VVLVVNLQPSQAKLLAYQGDPFDFTIVLRSDGVEVDATDWEWRATIEAGPMGRIDFEIEAEPHGARLWLRGDVTARLPRKDLAFDVTTRQPEAGEGVTVLHGRIQTQARVTEPLRGGVDDLLVPTPS
jgi:hypothetical protein